MKHYDVAIVGAGIVGLAHAWMAHRRGLSVLLLERSSLAQGASVRNFGMLWPIGQPSGDLYELALHSRDFWLQLQSLNVLHVQPCGSIHLAHQADELAVLEEFCSQDTHPVAMLTTDEVQNRSPLANPAGLLGGMHSDMELRVNPRTASAAIACWLAEQGVQCCFETTVVDVQGTNIKTADGRMFESERVIICSGSDLNTLFPEAFRESGLQLCKLQMLKSVAQPDPAPNEPHLASGLTLRHYDAFRECPSHPALRNRIANETPELDRYGIHVMASQLPSGEVLLGDSHQYGKEITPFDSTQIDDLILRELRKVIQLGDWTINQRWNGVYAKHPSLPVFEDQISEHVHVFVGTGGAGMTMSFGLADRAWQRWMGEII